MIFHGKWAAQNFKSSKILFNLFIVMKKTQKPIFSAIYTNVQVILTSKFWNFDFFHWKAIFMIFFGYEFEIFCIAHWLGKSLHFFYRICQYLFYDPFWKTLIGWFILYLHRRILRLPFFNQSWPSKLKNVMIFWNIKKNQ